MSLLDTSRGDNMLHPQSMRQRHFLTSAAAPNNMYDMYYARHADAECWLVGRLCSSVCACPWHSRRYKLHDTNTQSFVTTDAA
jgi:hypothetical protein